jgi:hypothetical protein
MRRWCRRSSLPVLQPLVDPGEGDLVMLRLCLPRLFRRFCPSLFSLFSSNSSSSRPCVSISVRNFSKSGICASSLSADISPVTKIDLSSLATLRVDSPLRRQLVSEQAATRLTVSMATVATNSRRLTLIAWIPQGDDRGIYGQEGARLMHLIEGGRRRPTSLLKNACRSAW